MWGFIKKYNIALQLFALVLTLSFLSIYNLIAQKQLLLQQMRIDADNVVRSIASSIHRFQDIKSTMGLEKLVTDISLQLEIFEFRYIDKDGVVISSMFKDEINHKYLRPSFIQAMNDPLQMDKFYFEVRDYVPVMAISHPVYVNNELSGYIDLSVDVSEYDYVEGGHSDFAIKRRQVDIRNLLSAISGSINNSLNIFESIDLHNFLKNYVMTTQNILQMAILDTNNTILVSSNNKSIEKYLALDDLQPPSRFIEFEGRYIYRIITNDIPLINDDGKLLLLFDANSYIENEKQLVWTATLTSIFSIMFASFIAYSIYSFNLELARRENFRLEGMVRERTREIEKLSMTDTLTGLWNRSYLEEMLEVEFRRADRHVHALSLLLMDLDHFKNINDKYGHRAGDEVLRQVTQRVKGSLRLSDVVCRYGGEEIVILLPETSLDNSAIVAEKIRKALANDPIFYNGQQIPVTASIGICEKCDYHTDAQQVLAGATRAMYYSKEHGHNRVSTCLETQQAAKASSAETG